MPAKVYVVLVNYNNWQDTIACLENLLLQDYASFQIVLVDNASTDDSPQFLRMWQHNQVRPFISVNHPLRKLLHIKAARRELKGQEQKATEKGDIIFIESDRNLGFAGGNNLGLRYVAAQADATYVWLLNNDTLLHTDAISRCVNYMQSPRGHDKALAGCQLNYFHNTKKAQCINGYHYTPATGKIEANTDSNKAENVSFVAGASIFTRFQWLQKPGPLQEDYFLYFEELDLCNKIRKLGGKIGFIPDLVVYHKEGAVINQKTATEKRSFTADFYSIRNRLLITRRFYPACLPLVYLTMLVAIWNRARRGQTDRIPIIIRLMISPEIMHFKFLPK